MVAEKLNNFHTVMRTMWKVQNFSAILKHLHALSAKISTLRMLNDILVQPYLLKFEFC